MRKAKVRKKGHDHSEIHCSNCLHEGGIQGAGATRCRGPMKVWLWCMGRVGNRVEVTGEGAEEGGQEWLVRRRPDDILTC